MKRWRLAAAAALLSLWISGCIGTTGQVVSRYAAAPGDKFAFTVENPGGMSAEGLTILKNKLDAELSASGLLAAGGDPSARKVEVTINHYYMRHGAARALAGIMAGKDNIRSTVKVVDATTGAVLGEQSVESGNATAMGTSRGLIEGHAKEIVQFLRGQAK